MTLEALMLSINIIASASQMDPAIVKAVISVETDFHNEKIGKIGERGLGQVRPETAEWILERNVNFDNVYESILATAEILRYYQSECGFKKNYTWVICYNSGVAGAKKVKKSHKNPYYRKVMQRMELFKRDKKVSVVDVYGIGNHAIGFYKGESMDYGYQGYHLVQIVPEGIVMRIEPGRIKEEEWVNS